MTQAELQHDRLAGWLTGPLNGLRHRCLSRRRHCRALTIADAALANTDAALRPRQSPGFDGRHHVRSCLPRDARLVASVGKFYENLDAPDTLFRLD